MSLLSYWISAMNQWAWKIKAHWMNELVSGKYAESIYDLLHWYRRFSPSRGALFKFFIIQSIPQRPKQQPFVANCKKFSQGIISNLCYQKFAILFNAFLGENVVFYHRENIWNVFGCRSDVMLRIPIDEISLSRDHFASVDEKWLARVAQCCCCFVLDNTLKGVIQ